MKSIKILAVVAMLACTLSCGNRQKNAATEATEDETVDMTQYIPDIKVGTPAPETVVNTPEGVALSLADFAGQWVVLDFWASWCHDCRDEFSAVKEFYEEYAPKGINLIGVSFDDDEDAWKKCIEEEGFAWPQVCNLTKWKDNPVSQAYGIHWIPTMVVIDPTGKVAGTAFTVKELKALLSDKI